MTKTIHPSMMATMQHDIAEYNDAAAMVGRLNSNRGWSPDSLRFEGIISSPGDRTLAITDTLSDEISPDEMTAILGILVTAQQRIVDRLQKNVQEEYGISIG